MIKRWLWSILILVLTPAAAQAQGPLDRPFGLGLIAGDPVGLNAKVWFTKKHTLSMAIGYGYFPHYNGFSTYVDYQFNAFTIIPAKKVPFELLFDLGIGGKLGYWHYHRDKAVYNEFGFGVRFPFGVTMVFSKVPFDAFLELAPCMAFIAPDPFWFDLDAAIGGRFYF